MPSGGARRGAGRPRGRGKYNEPTQAIRLPINVIDSIREDIYPQSLPFYSSKVSASFPSPAEDDIGKKLDLNKHLIKHPASTFLVRANGL